MTGELIFTFGFFRPVESVDEVGAGPVVGPVVEPVVDNAEAGVPTAFGVGWFDTTNGVLASPAPFLFRDQTQVYPWIGHPGYNLTTDMADEAINYLRGLNNAAPDKPFFLYYVPGGSHAPHQPTPEWIKKISDLHLFDQGWEKLRETNPVVRRQRPRGPSK